MIAKPKSKSALKADCITVEVAERLDDWVILKVSLRLKDESVWQWTTERLRPGDSINLCGLRIRVPFVGTSE